MRFCSAAGAAALLVVQVLSSSRLVVVVNVNAFAPVRIRDKRPSSTATTSTLTSSSIPSMELWVAQGSISSRWLPRSNDKHTQRDYQEEEQQQQQQQQQQQKWRREMVSKIAMSITALASSPSSSSSPSPSPLLSSFSLLMRTLDPLGLSKRILSPSSNTATTTTIKRAQQLALTKWHNLSNDDLAEIILRDGRERQFLFTADMTREIYDEQCTFSDGSDLDGAYPLDAWIRGCKFLFDANKSHCQILESTLQVSSHQVQFRFTESLQFHSPKLMVLRPRVHLSGCVVMHRDPQTGLIVSYEEQWNQNLQELLQGARWGLR